MVKIESVVAFGKIIYIPTEESVPPLPNMNLLFFKEDERNDIFPWRAVCIDLEIDAAGDSMDEAWNNLKDALTIYIDMEKKAVGDIIGAAKRIIDTVFTESTQKTKYMGLYLQVKRLYTMSAIESGNTIDPIQNEKQKLEKLESENDSIRHTANVLRKAA
jgi:hypothetical protein